MGCACADDDTVWTIARDNFKKKKNYWRYREDLAFPNIIKLLNYYYYYYYYGSFIIKCIGLLQFIWPEIIAHLAYRTTKTRILKD